VREAWGRHPGLVGGLTSFDTGMMAETGGLANATGDTIRGTQIVNNSFHDNVAPINLLNGNPGNLPASANNVVEDTLISGNICSNNKQVCIAIGQQFANATGNVIRNTQIVNNVISFLDPGAGGGIGVNGGGAGGNSVFGFSPLAVQPPKYFSMTATTSGTEMFPMTTMVVRSGRNIFW